MAKTIVNLTVPIVVGEIETVLATYSHHPYQHIFAHPDRREELVAYVLNRVHNAYITCDEDVLQQENWTLPRSCSLQEQEQIDVLIQQGIQDLLGQHLAEWESPEETDTSPTPSHWFG
jgi:hypothetical protein